MGAKIKTQKKSLRLPYSSYHLNLSFLHLEVISTTLETPKNTALIALIIELRSQGKEYPPKIFT